MNRTHVLTESNELHQKALSLYEDFSKGSPRQVTHHTIYCKYGMATDSGIGLD